MHTVSHAEYNVFFNYQRMNYDNANVDSDYFDKMVRVSIRYVQD